MGGGGGPTGIGNVQDLIEKAKGELRKGESDAKRNVFISFAMEDKDSVELLRGQAASSLSDIEFNDWSVQEPFNSANAAYIKEKISERIERSSATVVYVSEDSAKSKWVDWEIKESIRQGKKVVGVHPKNQAPQKLPTAVTKNGIKVVQWSKLAAELSKNA